LPPAGPPYRWEVALEARPVGWHLVTDYEWQGVELALGVPFEELAEAGFLALEGDPIQDFDGTGHIEMRVKQELILRSDRRPEATS